MGRTSVYSLSLSPKLVARVDRLAKAIGYSRSAYVERLLRQSLEDEELGVRALTDPRIMEPLVKMLSNRDWVRSMAKAMNEELDEKQLSLFTRGMEQLAKSSGKKKGVK